MIHGGDNELDQGRSSSRQ